MLKVEKNMTTYQAKSLGTHRQHQVTMSMLGHWHTQCSCHFIPNLQKCICIIRVIEQ
jgi:hypothetical protein